MNSDELLKADIPPTELPFPDGLKEILVHFPELRIRRGTLVFLDGELLPVPDRDYTISHTGLVIPYPIKTLSVVSVVIAGADERWYYSHADGWGRL
jgi:hypothetical protein